VKRRRGFFLAASALAGAVAIATACSFPEPQVIDDAEGGTASSSSGNVEPVDGSVPKDATLVDSVFAIDGNENVDPDGASQEASVAPEAGPPIDASGCPDKCDCDGDGFRSKNASCPDAGRDCNDLDPFIPHDGFVSSKPVGHNGDWDCNGTVTKQYAVNVSCGLLTDCSAQGFKTDPACGGTGEYVFCKPALLGLGVACTEDRTEGRAQGCR